VFPKDPPSGQCRGECSEPDPSLLMGSGWESEGYAQSNPALGMPGIPSLYLRSSGSLWVNNLIPETTPSDTPIVPLRLVPVSLYGMHQAG